MGARRRWLLIGILLSTGLLGCRFAPTPNPAIETSVEPVADVPMSGLASLAEVAADRLSVHIEVLPGDFPPLAAEVRRGTCASDVTVARLTSGAPGNPFLFTGEIDGTLASTPPVAVVILDATTGRLLGCAVLGVASTR